MRPAAPWRSPLAWLGGVLVLYLGYPLLAFLVRLVRSPQRGFRVPGLGGALVVSLEGATLTLALVSLVGVPLAYVLARSRGRLASVVGVVVQVPLALPPLMGGIVMIYLVGPYTLLGRLFGGRLTDSMAGVVIAMSFVSAPFLVVAARAAFRAVDPSRLEVAATLGHGEVARFFRVAVPEAGEGIRAGMLLTWLRAFGEYGAVVVLAYNPASLPVYTYNQFSGRGLPTTLAPTALALGVAVLAVVASRARRPRRSVPAREDVPVAARPRPGAGAPAPTPRPVRFDLDHRVGDFHLRLAHEGETAHLGVLGPSGAGKSALLRSIAGLYGAAPGPVWFGEEEVTARPVERRAVGYVAQGFALYPHLSVWRHALFARGATPELARHWIDRLGLSGLEGRRPAELSGGQRQRVGLAQVLCASPEVLLLDEPFSALDVPVRLELRRELRALQRETGLATVLVTHDPAEAAFLADELLVIAEGRLLQRGPSRELFARPASERVARLLGVENLLEGVVAGPGVIEVAGGRLPVAPHGLAVGTAVRWSVRPERVALAGLAPGGAPCPGGALVGEVVDVVDTGLFVDVVVALGGGVELRARAPEAPAALGERRALVVEPEAVALWPVAGAGSAG